MTFLIKYLIKEIYLYVCYDWSKSSSACRTTFYLWFGLFLLFRLLKVGFLLISVSLSQKDILLLQPQGSDLCTDRRTLFSVTHGADWIDFVKDSITLKETYNLTSDCIFLSFYCHIFHHTHCFLAVTKLFIFLLCYISRAIYCL